MSLITRCSACETLFRVVPDQLRISDGWVRCGRCNEVFNASQHLLPGPQAPVGPAAQDETLLSCSEEAVPAKSDIDPISPVPDASTLDSSLQLPNPQERQEQQEPFLSVPLQDQVIQVDHIATPASDSPSLEVDVAGSDSLQSTPQNDDQDAAEESSSFTDCATPSFLQHRNADSVWSRPAVRGALVLLGAGLALALCGQIVFHERDRIGAMYPKLRPLLQAFCRPLSCSLSALRQIEFIAIESSSFVKIGATAYRLNLALKNSGQTTLAMPAIEVTLTDSSDQPVVRRVFLPADLDAKSNTLAARTELPASFSLVVNASASASQITGYRLLAFYP